jgi:molecular chaperone HscC
MIVGIDLGTTNSLIAVWENGAARLIPNGLGDYLTPSCISVDEDGTILVGRAARDRLQTHPDQSTAAFKRHMGSDAQITLGKRAFRAEELSALILRALKDDAETALGQPVTSCIITVPAYFSDAQRKATRAAGQLAGMKVDRLLNEPTAAALAYGIHLRTSETRFLVFDLGGGTFDVSVLDLFDSVMEVQASSGDNYLGGEDFTALLVARFLEQCAVPDPVRSDARFLQRLGAQVELAKRGLSEHQRAAIRIAEGGAEYAMDIDEAAFEKLCSPLLQRLRDPVERALRDANLEVSALDAIVLAGGATRMPIVRRMVARMFGRSAACDINPDQVVALGAAVQAGLRANDAALDEVVMTDVAPYSLGVATSLQYAADQFSDGHFDPVIERNTIVPVSRVKRYYPTHDGQTRLDIKVYQGEARMAWDNILLGTLTIRIAPGKCDDNPVDVRFTYDVNGLLQVEATLVSTNDTKVLLIEGNPGLMSEQEISERFAALSKLKIHPRERLEYRTLSARAERLYQQLRGAEREQLGERIMAFDHALASQDQRQYGPAAKAFLVLLDNLEHDGAVLADQAEGQRA